MLASATVSPKGMPPPRGRVALVLSPLPLLRELWGCSGVPPPILAATPDGQVCLPQPLPTSPTHMIHVSKGSD